MKIFAKLLTLVGGTIVVLVSAFCLIGFFELTKYGEETTQKQLRLATQSVQQTVGDMLRSQAITGKLIAENSAFAKAVAAKDLAAVKKFAAELNTLEGVSLVTICDTETTVLARGHSDKAGDKLGDRRISSAIPLKEGKQVVGMEPGNATRLTLASGTPIKHDGAIVGAVILGIDLSSGAFVQSVKRSLDMETTIFLDDIRVSTTVLRDGKPVIDTPLNNEDIYNRVMRKNETVFSENTISGRMYDTAYWAWKDMTGKPAGMFFVGTPRDLLIEAQREAVTSFVIAGLMLGAGLMLAGGLFARAIARPVREATVYAQAIAAGDFSRDIKATSSDEIGNLITAMKQIPSVLQQLIGDIAGGVKVMQVGHYRMRLNPADYNGAYGELVSSVNSVADAYTDVLDELPLPIMSADKAMTVNFANKASQNAMGGELVESFVTEGETNFGKKAMETAANHSAETKFRKDGKEVFMAVTTVPLEDENGRAAAFIEILTNLTEIRTQQAVMMQVANQASEISNRVAAASEELAAQVEQVSRGAEMQRERVESTASAMTEMNATVLEVARSAGEASEQSDGTRVKAQEGAELVNNVVRAINTVNSVSQNLHTNMQELGTQAESIGSVMNVISDIADQTNLLALNAAIEAARAGEAGRGFAVVADEVRKLAEKTMEATQEVGSSISAVQQSARINIEEVSKAVTSVTEANDLANSSGQALNEIVHLASANSSVVASIATAAEEQSATSEEISRSIDEINQVVGETTEGMVQSSAAVQDLSRMAQELRRVMEGLR